MSIHILTIPFRSNKPNDKDGNEAFFNSRKPASRPGYAVGSPILNGPQPCWGLRSDIKMPAMFVACRDAFEVACATYICVRPLGGSAGIWLNPEIDTLYMNSSSQPSGHRYAQIHETAGLDLVKHIAVPDSVVGLNSIRPRALNSAASFIALAPLLREFQNLSDITLVSQLRTSQDLPSETLSSENRAFIDSLVSVSSLVRGQYHEYSGRAARKYFVGQITERLEHYCKQVGILKGGLPEFRCKQIVSLDLEKRLDQLLETSGTATSSTVARTFAV